MLKGWGLSGWYRGSSILQTTYRLIVNGFVKTWITAALDGQENQQEELHEMENDYIYWV